MDEEEEDEEEESDRGISSNPIANIIDAAVDSLNPHSGSKKK